MAGSDSYANLHAQLMTWEECEPQVAEFCEQAGIPAERRGPGRAFRAKLTETAARVDAGYPANTDLRLEGGKPVLARRKGADRSAVGAHAGGARSWSGCPSAACWTSWPAPPT